MNKQEYVRTNIKMAAYHRTAESIIESIPTSLWPVLTRKQLVIVGDALHESHSSGKAIGEYEAAQ